MLMNLPTRMSMLGVMVLFLMLGCGQASGDATDDPHAGHEHQTTAMSSFSEDDSKSETALPNYVAAPYPMQTCVVAGDKLGSMGKPTSLVHEGREVKFCCAACEPKFKADPEKYLAKIDAAVVEQQLASYPLDTCVISGDKLGDKPVNFVYENRLIRFCCDMCVDTFLKDPNTSIAKLNAAAVKAQLADYPAKTCPVSGADLGSMGKPIDMMVGHRLVRLCCDGCVGKLNANPAGMLTKVYGNPEPAEAE